MKRFFTTLLMALLFVAMPLEAFAANHQFTDIPTTHRFHNDIQLLLERDIVNKTDQFYPGRVVTRGEIAELLAREAGFSNPPTNTKFKDVQRNHPRSGYIYHATDAGIIQGFPDGTFRPDAKLTRGQLAQVLSRAFDLKATGKVSFKDVTPKVSSYEGIQKLVGAGITSGYADGTFRPHANLSRGEVAAFIARGIRAKENVVSSEHVKGTLLVGDEIEAGEYALFRTDAQKTVRIKNDETHHYTFETTLPESGPLFVNVKWGYVIDAGAGLRYMKAEDYLSSGNSLTTGGHYRIGKDLPAGTYKLEAINKDRKSFYLVQRSSNPFDSHLAELRFEFPGTAEVTVRDGDYLFVENARQVKK